MRRPIVAGNWKMHGTRAENAALVEAVLGAWPASAGECIVCPPDVYLQGLARVLRDSPVRLGAQDVSAEPTGAFTGDVSAAMLADIGAEYVIVGHSERRSIHGESDTLVARKFAAALGKSLRPILPRAPFARMVSSSLRSSRIVPKTLAKMSKDSRVSRLSVAKFVLPSRSALNSINRAREDSLLRTPLMTTGS